MAVRNCPDASIGIGGRFPDFWRFYLRGVAGAEREDPAQQVQGCKRSCPSRHTFRGDLLFLLSLLNKECLVSVLREPGNWNTQSAVGSERPEQGNQRLWRSGTSLRGGVVHPRRNPVSRRSSGIRNLQGHFPGQLPPTEVGGMIP